jgi:phage terminase large subunit
LAAVVKRDIEIPYTPRGAFLEFHDRKQRFAVNVCHRRAGKTVAAVNDLIRSALECKLDRPRVYYLSPTYAQSKKVAWDYAKHYSAAEPLARFNEAELRIDYPNGGRLQLVGGDNPDSLRGIYADDVVLDEFAFMSAEVWQKIIRPALSDRQGRATFISSVNGRNEFYRLYKAALEQPDEWFAMNLKAGTSGLIDPRELKALRRDMSEADYAQEYENDFDVAAKGSYYGALITAADLDGRITGVPYDGAAMVDTAWDLGIGDSTAIWFMQEVGREIHAIDYYEASGLPLSHYAEVLTRKGYAYRDHIVPHDAEARELGTGKTRSEILKGMGIRTRIAPKLSVEDGIAAVRTMLPKMWFDARKCADGVEKLRQYRSEYDEKRQVLSNRPLHDFSSHCADAIRMYAVAYRQRTKQVRTEVEAPLRWV